MASLPPFEPTRFFERMRGHGGRLGIEYRSHGDDWCEMALPYRHDLIGNRATGVLASGPILTLMDMATSADSSWRRRRSICGSIICGRQRLGRP